MEIWQNSGHVRRGVKIIFMNYQIQYDPVAKLMENFAKYSGDFADLKSNYINFFFATFNLADIAHKRI